MSVELVNPSGIPEPMGYAQVGIATGSRTVYVSGQVARSGAEGTPVAPGDLAGQVEQAYTNLLLALEGVGASYADVAKVTVYVVGLTEEALGPFVEGAVAATHEIDPTKPMTMIGVASLAEADLLVEIEAIAVLD